MKKYIGYLAILLVLLGCSNNEEEIPNWEEGAFDDELSKLVYEAYIHRNDSTFPDLCKALNDSILTDTNLLYLRTIRTEFADDIINAPSDWWWFYKIDKTLDYRFCGAGLEFSINIMEEDNVLVEYEKTNISDIVKIGRKEIFYPEKEYYERRIKEDSIPYFGKVETPRSFCFLSAPVIEKKGFSVKGWKLFFNCLHEVIKIYDMRKDELAMQKFRKKYKELSSNMKAVLADNFCPNIFINFDMDSGLVNDMVKRYERWDY